MYLSTSIARLCTARTAFVGRTLRGPVNRAVLIKSLGDFQHVFGGLWQPSPLGYAVEQFFDNGGREALIVRVVNGGRCASLSLNAGAHVLRLRAVRPGSREFLRASVDYDNIPAENTGEFNLAVQRLRNVGTAHVDDQEIFRAVSVLPDSDRYLPGVIAGSELIQLAGPVPAQRPDRTPDPASGLAAGYVHSNADGDDGAPLTDYDLIGSSVERTGLFALSHDDQFNFLCIPPLSREQDVGPSVLLVGARFCKERRALLIVDPPARWLTADDALLGMRDWPLSNENALMYFPRILAHDKLRGQFESFAPCGAVAGMLARFDEQNPLWSPPKHEEAILRPGYRPNCLVGEDRRRKLARLGVNTIQSIRSAARMGVRPRTLAAGRAGSADWQYLAPRRLALFIVNCIERGTRWAMLAPSAESVAAEVRAFFVELHAAGAFPGRALEDSFVVICDPDVIPGRDASSAEFHLLVGFAGARQSEFHGFRISHAPAGSKVQPVGLNRLQRAAYTPAEPERADNLACQLPVLMDCPKRGTSGSPSSASRA